jgi:hypothetical protein
MPAAAWAGHGKSIMSCCKTGDRFTCEIVRLVRGKMTVKTDALGTVSVEWNKVVHRVDSPVESEVEIKSWRALVRRDRVPSRRPIQLTVGTARAHCSRQQLDDVVELTPIERNFWDRLDARSSAGFSFTQASDVHPVVAARRREPAHAQLAGPGPRSTRC